MPYLSQNTQRSPFFCINVDEVFFLIVSLICFSLESVCYRTLCVCACFLSMYVCVASNECDCDGVCLDMVLIISIMTAGATNARDDTPQKTHSTSQSMNIIPPNTSQFHIGHVAARLPEQKPPAENRTQTGRKGPGADTETKNQSMRRRWMGVCVCVLGVPFYAFLCVVLAFVHHPRFPQSVGGGRGTLVR